MKTVQLLRFHKVWFWFTSLFAVFVFGYGFISSIIHLDLSGLWRWNIGFAVWCTGWFVVSKLFFGRGSIKRSFQYIRAFFQS